MKRVIGFELLLGLLSLFSLLILSRCKEDDEIEKLTNSNRILLFQAYSGADTYNSYIDNTKDSIYLTIPENTDLKSLKFYVAITEDSELSPPVDSIKDWSKKDINFTVSSAFGNDRNYGFKLFYDSNPYTEQSGNQILSFIISDGYNTYPAFIDNSKDSIYLHMPKSVDLSKIKISANISEGASISPAIEEIENWNDKVTITVISQTKEARVYTVTLFNDNKDIYDNILGNSILSFSLFDGTNNYPMYINSEQNLIVGKLPAEVNIQDITASVSISEGASIEPNPAIIKDWSTERHLSVKSVDNNERIYTVRIGQKDSETSYDNNITSFIVTDGKNIFPLFIDESTQTISGTLPYSTDISQMNAAVTISDKAGITPKPETITDWSSPVVFNVLSFDGESKKYTVTITKREMISECKILSFNVSDGTKVYPLFIDDSDKTIYTTLLVGTELANLKASATISQGASIEPLPSGITDWSNPQIFTVTSSEGKTQSYTVTIDKEVANNTILEFKLSDGSNTYTGVINDNNIFFDMEGANVDLTTLKAQISLPAGADIFPHPNDVRDWTTTKKFMVVDQNDNIRRYSVDVINTASVTHTGDITSAAELQIFKDSGKNTIDGNIHLPDNITDLSFFNNLKYITGYIYINRNSNITDLEGFNNLVNCGSLTISNNDKLTNIDALKNITEIKGTLSLIGNGQLANLDGLENLRNTNKLNIGDNTNLTSLEGLKNLENVETRIAIFENTNLTNLKGLEKLRDIKCELSISENPSLTSMEGLNNLENIDNRLSLFQNPNLTNLNGLENLKNITGELNLYENTNLTSLEGLANLEYAGDIYAYKNNSLTDFKGLEKLTRIENKLSILSNSNITSLEGLNSLTHVGDIIKLSSNDNLINLEGLNSLEFIKHDFTINNNNKLINLEGLDNLKEIGTYLNITNNQNLTSLNGLENLENTGIKILVENNPSLSGLVSFNNALSVNILTIKNNDNLTNLKGLEELSSSGSISDLTISDNDNLTSLEGLENFTSITYLNIYNNPKLTNLNYLNNLETATNIYITNNEGLVNLEGLESLTKSNITISNNKNLINLSGLTSFKDAHLTITRNENLVSLEGLESVETVGTLNISYNANLTSIAALSNQNSPETNLTIKGNPLLENLTGLEGCNALFVCVIAKNNNLKNLSGLKNVMSISDNLEIEDNPQLKTLEGLEKVTAVYNSIYITDNQQLESLKGLDNLISVYNSIRINDNLLLDDYSSLQLNELYGTFSCTGNKVNVTKSDIMK